MSARRAPATDGETPVLIADAEREPAWAAAVGARVLPADALEADPDDAARVLAGAGCALVDAAMPGFVSAARAVHALDGSVQVVAVTPAEGAAAVRRALLYAPGLGEVWLASPAEVNAALTERAGGVTRQRRRYARTRARIAAERVTESPQRTERALISDAYLAGLLRVLPDAVFSVDGAGRVLSANAVAERTFGGARGGTLVGARLPEVLGLDAAPASVREPSVRAPSVRELLERATREGMLEVRHRCADGGACVGELRAVPIRHSGPGGGVGPAPVDVWAVVVHDVTARHAANAQLRRAAAELEAQAEDLRASARALSERTVEAEAARQRAEAASRARSDFVAMMSHEIRTPINAIVGYTQLLEIGVPDPVTPAQREQLARVGAAAQHLLGLVDDVLDVAKVDAGELRVSREPASADRAMADAMNVIRPIAAQRDIRVVDRCEHDDGGRGARGVRYVGDEGRVRQVLVNLLSNAVKFTAPGGTVTLACGAARGAPAGARVDGDGPWAYLRVADTGIGIAPEQQAAVFEPFVQAERGRTRTRGGTGLGLTISRRLARLMGGDLTLESVPNAGTVFTLWLPATGGRDGATDRATDRAPDGSPDGAPAAAGRRRTRGLAEVGRALRAATESILAAYVARLRADPAIPIRDGVGDARLESHAITLLADMAQSLVIMGDPGDDSGASVGDGTAIQRAIAEQHGARRQAQGWSEEALRRDHEILRAVVAEALGAEALGGADAAAEGLHVLAHLAERGAAISLAAYRHAREREGTPPAGVRAVE